MMPQRASRRRILSIRACIVNLLKCVRTIVDGGGAGATPALPLGRRRTDADLTERPSGALEGRGGAAPASPPARGRGYRRGASRAPGALRARVGRAFPTSRQARAAESIRLRGSRPRAEGPRRPASNSLDVAEILEALANLLLLFLGVGGVLGGLGRGRRGGFGAAFSHAGPRLPGRPRRRRARSRSGPDAAGGRGR